MERKGVSPVIATVLLVAMVIVIGLIIFLWFRGLTKEAVTKFGGKNIELVCQDVDFSASYALGSLSIFNEGNVPIFEMKIKIYKPGEHATLDLEDLSPNWPDQGLRQGGAFLSEDLSTKQEFSGADEISVIPVLLGSSKKGRQTHMCDEQYGQKIII